MIEFYDFGKITIDGKRYTTDVIIFPDHVRDKWWRNQGHSLSIEDLREIAQAKPEVLIIGTGYNGYMEVPNEVLDHFTSKGTEVIVEKTGEACKTYNRLASTKQVVAAFHLTC